MSTFNVMLSAIAIIMLDICVLVLIFSAYRERHTGKKRWSKIGVDMELVEPGKTYPLECDEIIIGRHASANIRLMDMSVSRYHALLTVCNGVWTIKDIGSKSGIYINGSRVKQARLCENDIIKLGKYKLTIRKRRNGNNV